MSPPPHHTNNPNIPHRHQRLRTASACGRRNPCPTDGLRRGKQRHNLPLKTFFEISVKKSFFLCTFAKPLNGKQYF